MLVQQDPAIREKQCDRQRLQSDMDRELPGVIEQHIPDPGGLRLEVLLHPLAGLALVGKEESDIGMIALCRREQGHFTLARGTPGCPQVNDDGPSDEVLHRGRLALQRCQRNVRERHLVCTQQPEQIQSAPPDEETRGHCQDQRMPHRAIAPGMPGSRRNRRGKPGEYDEAAIGQIDDRPRRLRIRPGMQIDMKSPCSQQPEQHDFQQQDGGSFPVRRGQPGHGQHAAQAGCKKQDDVDGDGGTAEVNHAHCVFSFAQGRCAVVE